LSEQKLPFIDREEIVSQLVNSITRQGKPVNFGLIGPRQIGKTSILREVTERVGGRAIVVNLDFSIHRFSPEDFAQALMQSLTAEYAKRVGGVKKLISRASEIAKSLQQLRRIRLSFSIDIDGQGKPSVSIKPELAEKKINKRALVDLAFAYATKIAEESKVRVVVIIDEFQHFAEYSSYPELKGILDILRHFLDERGDVSLIASGSRIHFLTNILGSGRSPLFGRFTLVEVGELEERYAIELFLKVRGEASQDEARRIYHLVGGHPFYILALAENMRENETAEDAYKRLLVEPTGALNLYARYVVAEDLGSHAKARQSRFLNVLSAIGAGNITASMISKETRIALTSIPWYVQQLTSYDLIQKTRDGYAIKDRVLRDYFANVEAV
jgi:AAA+ ATPase superfamily predicted ATPase